MAKSKLEWALDTARRGFLVSPLHHTHTDGSCTCGDLECPSPGKHPILKGGFSSAVTDEAQIRTWWTEWPHANIGVWPDDRKADVDLDTKKPGANGIESLAKHMGAPVEDMLRMTYTVRTPTGGYHLYFDVDQAASNRVGVLLGVDIRGKGGYVVGPGSTIWKLDEFGEPYESSYTVHNDGEVIPLPLILSDLVRPKKERSEVDTALLPIEMDTEEGIEAAIAYVNSRPPAIQGMGGNHHTYITACHLRERYNISRDMAFNLLWEETDFNQRCDPPWSEQELETIVKNAYSYANEQIGSMGGLLIDYAMKGGEDVFGGDSELPKEDKDSRWSRFKKHLHTEAEFQRLELHYDFVVEGWFPTQGYSIMLGKRSSGKTTVCLDMVMHIVNDCRTWHSAIIEQGWHCVYLAAEDVPGVKERIEAWRKHNGIYMTDPRRLRVYDFMIDLTSIDEVEAFADFIKEETKAIGKVFFVLDTWQRMTMLAESQSDDKAMQGAIANLELMCKKLKGPSIIIAHPPKANSDTVAGSMVIENASQAIWTVSEPTGGSRDIKVDRIKGAREGIKKTFKFEAVDIEGTTNLGKQRSAVVAKYVGGDVQSDEKDIESRPGGLTTDEIKIAEIAAEISLKIGNVIAEYGKNYVSGAEVAKLIYETFEGQHRHELTAKWMKDVLDIGFTKDEITAPHKGGSWVPKRNKFYIALDRLREKSHGKVKLSNGDTLIFESFRSAYKFVVEKKKPGIDDLPDDGDGTI